MQQELPGFRLCISSGSLVDAVLNLGLPAPIDVQVAGTTSSGKLSGRLSIWPGRSVATASKGADVYIPGQWTIPLLKLEIGPHACSANWD